MRDLTPLTTDWRDAAEEEILSSDSELQDIFSLSEAGNNSEAADRIEALLFKGHFDVRLLSIYLHQAVVEGGLEALGQSIRAWERALGPEWDKVGPSKRKDDQAGRRVQWFCSQTASLMEYHREKKTGEWSEWLRRLGADAAEELSDDAERLLDNLPENLGNIDAQVTRLVSLVREVRASAEAEAQANEEEEAVMSEKEPAQESSTQSSSGVDSDTVTLKVSHKFVSLIDKLQAFEKLLGASRFDKAALVSDDVLEELQSFDPRDYFPEVFADFSQAIAENADQLSPYWEQKESLQMQLLRQFYKVDLARFVED